LKAVGFEAFASLKAEEEGEWLLEAFVPPHDFNYLIGPRSLIILGKEGVGKTTLYRALLNYAQPYYLTVEWEPSFPTVTPSKIEGLLEMVRALFQSIALALLKRIANDPYLTSAPEWAKSFIYSFARYALGEKWQEELSARGLSEFIFKLSSSSPFPPSLSSSPPLCMAELIKAISSLGLKGIWIMGDYLDKWLLIDKEMAVECTKAFFSALPLFEVPGFCFKMVFPHGPGLSELTKASGIERRRIDIYRLSWSKEELRKIVERRFQVASGGSVSSLSQVIEPEALPELISWLERWGGDCPKGWLEAVRPLAFSYFSSASGRPLKKEEWLEVRRSIPPKLILNAEEKKVIVGWREIEDIPESLFSILAYLNERAGKICSREELYFKAYRKLHAVPQSPAEPGWEEPWSWSGVLDNLLYRLRQLIEPDPADPVLLIAVRGKGVKLERLL
jgi:hypothetical protein